MIFLQNFFRVSIVFSIFFSNKRFSIKKKKKKKWGMTYQSQDVINLK